MQKNRTPAALVISGLKPRNPLVIACRSRRAGVHAPRGHAPRQQAKRELHRELNRLHPPNC
ncbi:hypothetical protein [Caldimonas brevitalea]|uniref:Uncharacterized protein n=1 Tax=Caldimonas brevitalea TaxID=413882 RepID=A0A0G3BUM0_9BURK|nr:hypothetical protein [Caldimonas brevitalea]AKJ30230.1 hypothetical protein AAW51_3539 [Caldimonas brevitalea]